MHLLDYPVSAMLLALAVLGMGGWLLFGRTVKKDKKEDRARVKTRQRRKDAGSASAQDNSRQTAYRNNQSNNFGVARQVEAEADTDNLNNMNTVMAYQPAQPHAAQQPGHAEQTNGLNTSGGASGATTSMALGGIIPGFRDHSVVREVQEIMPLNKRPRQREDNIDSDKNYKDFDSGDIKGQL